MAAFDLSHLQNALPTTKESENNNNHTTVRLYHVTNVETTSPAPTWREIQWSVANHRKWDGPMYGLPVACFIAKLPCQPLKKSSVYPRQSSKGKTHWRVSFLLSLLPFRVFKIFERQSQVHLLVVPYTLVAESLLSSDKWKSLSLVYTQLTHEKVLQLLQKKKQTINISFLGENVSISNNNSVVWDSVVRGGQTRGMAGGSGGAVHFVAFGRKESVEYRIDQWKKDVVCLECHKHELKQGCPACASPLCRFCMKNMKKCGDCQQEICSTCGMTCQSSRCTTWLCSTCQEPEEERDQCDAEFCDNNNTILCQKHYPTLETCGGSESFNDCFCPDPSAKFCPDHLKEAWLRGCEEDFDLETVSLCPDCAASHEEERRYGGGGCWGNYDDDDDDDGYYGRGFYDEDGDGYYSHDDDDRY
uniref:Uncharacterized protein n=2 Tax=Paramoeba aestuarina TaxID=180227 RepID=A0A7S4U7G1_9EUKA|mmetsp:Transcript_4286/g.6400  ORF Transcript_4286/g.6400 Transcript_4286/m.6400 type:complete len:416 (+) Transcript_4286:365-1612(+)